jgi:hypothetical protein
MTKSVRFVCSVSHAGYRLIRRKDIKMTAFPSSDILNGKDQTGSWIELRSKDERTLYTRFIHDQPDEHIEVRSEKREESMRWEKTSGLEKIITFIVPDLDEAVHLVIMRRKPDKEDIKAVEVARFPLKQKD